jgi:hypothetical protein
MGILRHRRFRRQEAVPADGDSQQDDYENDEEGDDYDSSITTAIPSITGLPPSSIENQLDKAKAIGKEVIEKVPSKYLIKEKHFDIKFGLFLIHTF